tara:strand:- start:622 stop:822 length:201 start_codon:yes stop_codon:yes gene_type:complete
MLCLDVRFWIPGQRLPFNFFLESFVSQALVLKKSRKNAHQWTAVMPRRPSANNEVEEIKRMAKETC